MTKAKHTEESAERIARCRGADVLFLPGLREAWPSQELIFEQSREAQSASRAAKYHKSRSGGGNSGSGSSGASGGSGDGGGSSDGTCQNKNRSGGQCSTYEPCMVQYVSSHLTLNSLKVPTSDMPFVDHESLSPTYSIEICTDYFWSTATQTGGFDKGTRSQGCRSSAAFLWSRGLSIFLWYYWLDAMCRSGFLLFGTGTYAIRDCAYSVTGNESPFA